MVRRAGGFHSALRIGRSHFRSAEDRDRMQRAMDVGPVATCLVLCSWEVRRAV